MKTQTNDIATRLRNATRPYMELGWPLPYKVQRSEPLWLEAADEIDRLRERLESLRDARGIWKNMIDFKKWWHETGSGIAALPNHDHEEHAERVAQRAWDAASDPIDQMLLDEFLLRSNAAEANARIRQLLGVSEQLRKERDEARRVLKSIVEEFVQHAQTMNPFYPATPMHECEFSWNPECGKCNACEAWGDYVLICHPLGDTEEEEAP